MIIKSFQLKQTAAMALHGPGAFYSESGTSTWIVGEAGLYSHQVLISCIGPRDVPAGTLESSDYHLLITYLAREDIVMKHPLLTRACF